MFSGAAAYGQGAIDGDAKLLVTGGKKADIGLACFVDHFRFPIAIAVKPQIADEDCFRIELLFSVAVSTLIMSALAPQNGRALDLIDPTFYQLRMDLAHFAVVYHQGDKINDAQATRAWAQTWKLPHVTALPGGHWLVFDGKARGRAWYGWLKEHGFCC